MLQEANTIQDAVDYVSTAEYNSHTMIEVFKLYCWLAKILGARHDLEISDTTGCIDSGVYG